MQDSKWLKKVVDPATAKFKTLERLKDCFSRDAGLQILPSIEAGDEITLQDIVNYAISNENGMIELCQKTLGDVIASHDLDVTIDQQKSIVREILDELYFQHQVC